MQHVADNRHGQAGEVALVMPDRVEVEQALRRMRVPAVAGVDDVNMRLLVLIEMRGDQMRGTRLCMADDEHVGVHRDQIVDGVEQRFALRCRRDADVQVDDVGREPLRRDLESRARTRRVFEKEIEHRLTPQERHFLHLALADRGERQRGIQNVANDLGGQSLERQQVCELAVGVELWVPCHVLGTGSTPSDSRSPSRDSTIDKSRATASRAPT